MLPFETNLYNQISQASTLFQRAQHQHQNDASKEEIIETATEALNIYRSAYSTVRRCSNPASLLSSGDEHRMNLELRMAMILRFLAHNAASDGEDNINLAIKHHDDAVSLLVGVFDGDNEEGNLDGTLLTIPVPHKSASISFQSPTENQRVRAIASSLNALASLHAKLNDDRSAMDSYRETLEILRAATEENDANDKSVELDLAQTLMNVGTFHLRRDELDAAFNAYSTVYALHSSEEPDGMALQALGNLGIVHERRGELDKAFECYDRVRLQSVGVNGDNIETGHGWVNIGNVLQRKLDWDGAASAYTKAVDIYRREGCSRALSGALRNHGTCVWKQRRIVEAIDLFLEAVSVEEGIVSRLSESCMKKEGEQAKLSMAQLKGILGCLYLEPPSPSFQHAREAFEQAMQIYFDLGYDAAHPSVVWAGTNLEATKALEKSKQAVVPPPPPPNPPKKKPELVTRGVSDRTEFGGASAASSKSKETSEQDDSVFSGVEDMQSSMDELDDILSERVENIVRSVKERKGLDKDEPFDEEAYFDTGVNKKVQEKPTEDKQINPPLTSQHRNTSYTSFTEISSRNEGSQPSHEEELQDELNKTYQRYGEDSPEAAHAHVALANQYWQRGDRSNATEHYTIAHSIFEYKLSDNKNCASVLKALGDLNKEDEKYDAAKELYAEAMEIEITVYGHCLPQTLNAAGVVCLLDDDHRSAMEFHRRALQLQQKSLEEGNKYEMYETLVLIGNVYYSERNNLSNIRSKGFDYKEFIELGFLGWIANAHDMRGEYVKACQFYEESLQINMSKKRKESKKETALTLNRLGSLNRELGRYEEAIDYHQRAMLLQQSHSNSAKAMAAETCVLMGMTKAKMGQFQSALDLYEDSLLVLKAALGEKHLSIAKTMAQIGAVQFELSNHDRATAILSEAEEYQLATVGEFHRDTFETQTLLGRVLSATGRFDLALIKLHGVVQNQIQMFGANHPSIAETNQFIGECFLNQGLIAEARAMFVDCYNMRKKFFTLDQLTIAESMVDIIRARNGRPERSLAIYRNAMEIYKEYLSENHVQIGYLLIYEGDVHAELLDFGTAVDRYHKANNIFLKTFGEGHLVEADILVNIGKVLLRKCDYDGAKEQFCTALEIYNSKLPEDHPKIAATAQHLDRVEQEEALCV